MSLTPLLKKLASKNKEDRRSAAERLGRLGGTRAILPLIYASRRGGGETAKNAAIRALAKIGKPAVPFLIETLQADMTSKFRRASAASALGRIRDRRAIRPLLRATKTRALT